MWEKKLKIEVGKKYLTKWAENSDHWFYLKCIKNIDGARGTIEIIHAHNNFKGKKILEINSLLYNQPIMEIKTEEDYNKYVVPLMI